jgi:deoxyadenosine/deoxycytidine kinase
MLSRLCSTETAFVKFYEDLPPQPSINPEIYRKLFSLLLAFHLVGFVLSAIKQRVLMLFYETLVEHEGHVLKQIADLHYFANLIKVSRHSLAGKSLSVLTALLLRSLAKSKAIIIHLEGEPDSLRPRYLRRNTHIEPSDYINFQNRIYDELILILKGSIDRSIIKLDANRPILELYQEIISSIPIAKTASS